MKKCNMCGAILPDEAIVCSSCGGSLAVNQQNNVQNGNEYYQNNGYYNAQANNQNNVYGTYNSQNQVNQNASYNRQINFNPNQSISSLEEFFNQFASNRTKGWSKSLAIICIITAVFSLFIIGQTAESYGYVPPIIAICSVIDIIFYITFAVLQFKKKNWVFPLVVTIYGGIFSIIGIVSSGRPSGIVALIVGIFATVYLKKISDAYKIYKTTGQIPVAQI